MSWIMPHAHRGTLRTLREEKKLSQGDIEKRTGMLRCYISRVENGHTVPSFETLEKFARALEVPLYRFFYEGKKTPALPPSLKRKAADEAGWGETRPGSRFWERFHRNLSRMKESDRRLLLALALKMAGR
jgi:transcriptional regulator with XRE-family HTH domain